MICLNLVPSLEFLECGLCRFQFSSSHGLLRRRSSPLLNSSEEPRRRISCQPTSLPKVLALKPREDRKEQPGIPAEIPTKRNLSRAPFPELDDNNLDELPSFYKSRRKDSSPSREDVGGGADDCGYFARNSSGSSPGGPRVPTAWRPASKYVLAGLFVLGVGAGIGLDTVVNIDPTNVAPREVIDRRTPNPDVCVANGMSAMVLDQRLFIIFNPFNVYVSQAEVKPGCVLQQSNWRVLESRGLVNSEEVRDCKRNFNTFGWVEDLRQAPEVNCVYHSETAKNQFLKDPSKAALGDGFQLKSFTEP